MCLGRVLGPLRFSVRRGIKVKALVYKNNVMIIIIIMFLYLIDDIMRK